MNLNGKMMMAVVMMVGSLAATGCSKASAAESADNAVAPEETPATAPVENAANAVEQDARLGNFHAPIAPPAARFELRGVAPSARHFWTPGYYRWTGRRHAWVGGSWVRSRPGFNFVGPSWRHAGRRFSYTPGRWARRF